MTPEGDMSKWIKMVLLEEKSKTNVWSIQTIERRSAK